MKWKFTTAVFILVALWTSSCGRFSAADEINDPSGILLSQRLLQSAQMNSNSELAIKKLAELDVNKLVLELDNREKQLSFWINIYNGMVQYLLKEDADLWNSRNSFYSKERFIIAGESLSLEDVEHGIIRGGENKLGLGFIPQIFTSKFNRTFKVDGGEARAHFALNCGAIDCPPVEIYEPSTIDERLDHRTRSYLTKHSQLGKDGKKFITTPLVSWFRGDFSKHGGVKAFLVKYDVLNKEDKESVSLSYKDYDWTLATNVWAKD